MIVYWLVAWMLKQYNLLCNDCNLNKYNKFKSYEIDTSQETFNDRKVECND